jgi:Beta-1,3-glucanase
MDHRISMTLAALLATLLPLVPLACGGPSAVGSETADGSANTGSSSGAATGSSSGTAAGSSSGAAAGSSSGTSPGQEDAGASSGADSGSGTILLGGDAGAACSGDESTAGGFPAGFWDSSNIPAATGPMVIKFLNRTNGKYSDSELYWTFNGNNMNTTPASFADAPTFQFPAGAYNGRMYFFICPTGSTDKCGSEGPTDYYDFWEYAIGTNTTGPMWWINYDTTRVDAFALKIALDLHVTTGPDYYIGENCPTFAEDRTDTFASYVASVPAEFQPCGQAPNAPYRIPEPGGGCGFNAGGANADYYNSYETEMWTNNGITIPMPGPNGSGLGAYPDLSAAIYRHVGAAAGTWTAAGKLVNGNFWSSNPESSFYSAAPADYYAQWIHSRAIKGKQYAFPYDDVGGNSSDVGASGMVYMLAAVGW